MRKFRLDRVSSHRVFVKIKAVAHGHRHRWMEMTLNVRIIVHARHQRQTRLKNGSAISSSSINFGGCKSPFCDKPPSLG